MRHPLPLLLKIVLLLLLLLSPGLHAATLLSSPVECSPEGFAILQQITEATRLKLTLRSYAEQCPDSPQRAEALRLSACFASEDGLPEEALRMIRTIPPAHRTPADARFEGTILVGRKATAAEGLTLLRAINPATLSREEQGERLLALAEGLQMAGDAEAAVLSLNEALPLVTGERLAKVGQNAHLLLRERLNDAELSRLATRLPPSVIRLDLLTEQARRSMKKDPALAKRLLDEVLLATEPYPWRSDALQLRDQLAGGPWVQRGVGVILPLSGKFATFGEAVQRGINLALTERPAKAKPVSFIFRDVDSAADENTRAVERLAREDRVIAVIGPLTGSAAVAAGEAAQREGIPLISLAQREGIPDLGNFVFRDALTNARQIEALVRYATDQKKKRFAILAPQSRLGQDLAEAFVRQVEKSGGKVVARQDYTEGTIDFRHPVKLLKGENPEIPDPVDKEARRHIRSATTPLPPLPFDALFIPDTAENIGLIAPYLAFYGVEEALLLGTSAWHAPELLEKSPRYLEGSIFVDGFHAGSQAPQVQRFVERYLELYGEEPSILEATGYDLAQLLCSLLDRGDVRTRTELQQALERLKPVAGVTGTLAFAPNGESIKPLKLLTIRNGLVTEVN